MLNSVCREMEAENYLDLARCFKPVRKLSNRDADLQLCRDLYRQNERYLDAMIITYQPRQSR
jgi:hypothetical protein